MLNNLKKMINAEAESDLVVDLMLEATNNSIADMFIRDDGEIEMAEKDILDVLDKIPAYDEEAEMNKKLDKIAEFYIPEELKLDPIQESTESEEECLEEGLIKRDKHKVDKDGKVNVSIMISKNGNGFKAEGNIYDELVMAFPIPAPEKVLKGRKLKKYIRQDIETMFKDPKFSKYKIGKIKMVKGLAEAYEWEDDDIELESFEWEDNEMSEEFDKYLESLSDDEYGYEDYLEEGLFGKYRKMSNEDLRAKIEELEAEGNEVEAGKYRKELDRRLHKDSKKEARAEKKAAKAEARAAKKAAKRGEEVPAAESWDEYLESIEVEYDEGYDEYLESFADDEYGYEEYLEEGLFSKHRKMSDADLKAKIDELELEGKESEARKYKKELERRMRKEEKKKAKEGVKVPGTQPANQVAESWEEYLESFNNDKEYL